MKGCLNSLKLNTYQRRGETEGGMNSCFRILLGIVCFGLR
jgi:hypothetical protein